MFRYKKVVSLILASIMGISMMGCGSKDKETTEVVPEVEETEDVKEEIIALSNLEATITWWTYPVFTQEEGSADGTYEQELIRKFNEYYPNIKVNVDVLDYTTDAEKVMDVIEADGGALPNLILDDPSRISTYAKSGVLYNIEEMFTEEMKADLVNERILSACQVGEEYVMYPLSGSTYVMGFNRQMVEDCGAIDFMSREGDCAWTTENFEKTIARLHEAGFFPGSFFCSGIAGDYATRSFVTNSYDGMFMNEEMTAYTMSSEANQKGLTKMKEWMNNGWMLDGRGETGGKAVANFVQGNTAYCLLWSLPQALSNQEVMETEEVKVIPMPYPSEDGKPVLEYMLNGFAIFNKDDEAVLEASKYFVDFVTNHESVEKDAVIHSGGLSVRKSLGDLYQDDEIIKLYEMWMAYAGPYYNKVDDFQEMRIYWYQMLQEIVSGEYSVKDATTRFDEYANNTLKPDEEGEN